MYLNKTRHDGMTGTAPWTEFTETEKEEGIKMK